MYSIVKSYRINYNSNAKSWDKIRNKAANKKRKTRMLWFDMHVYASARRAERRRKKTCRIIRKIKCVTRECSVVSVCFCFNFNVICELNSLRVAFISNDFSSSFFFYNARENPMNECVRMYVCVCARESERNIHRQNKSREWESGSETKIHWSILRI